MGTLGQYSSPEEKSTVFANTERARLFELEDTGETLRIKSAFPAPRG
jgi:hypothetical protein